jgi:hypothetical protein
MDTSRAQKPLLRVSHVEVEVAALRAPSGEQPAECELVLLKVAAQLSSIWWVPTMTAGVSGACDSENPMFRNAKQS